MLKSQLNVNRALPGRMSDSSPALLFVSKGEGTAAALPRLMHKHDERLEIMFIGKGRGIYNIDGRHYAVQTGDVLIFNAGVIHDEGPAMSDELLVYCCGVDGLRLAGLGENQLTARNEIAVMTAGSESEKIAQLFELLWTQMNRFDRSDKEISFHLLNALLLSYLNIWESAATPFISEEMSLGQRIKTFIDKHYQDDVTLETIAQALNVNRFYLAHVFKTYSGYSPGQYLIRRRVGEAQTLLLSTDYGVTRVANTVGYDNVNNFHRIFSRLVGISPAKYKKRWLCSAIRGVHTLA